MKDQIVSEIVALLSELQLPVETGDATDIVVRTNFLDAGWSTGKKTIDYESCIFVNEQDKTVYMYEKTTEVKKGFSFGGGAESSFQTGKTLFRKVKSVQYGPDGKAYEIKLDLGAIPKAAKETAKKHGWKFKTVLKKSKALYPEGYSPAAPAAAPAAPLHTEAPADEPVKTASSPVKNTEAPRPKEPETRYSDPEKPLYAQPGSKTPSKLGNIVGLVGFGLVGLFLLVLMFAGGVTITGWILTIALFAGSVYLQRRIRHKGVFFNLALLIVAGIIMLVVAASFSSTGLSTARIENAHMTTGLKTPSMTPVDKVDVYRIDSPELIVYAELRSAPEYTNVTFFWTYLTGDIEIGSFEMDSGQIGTDIPISNNINNSGKPWPPGEYRVSLFVDDREKPDAQVEFEVR